MSEKIKIACIQMNTGECDDPAALGADLIKQAVDRNVTFVSTPEYTNYLAEDSGISIEDIEQEDNCQDLAHYRKLADDLDVWIHVGSLLIRHDHENMLVNRSYMIAPGGRIVARYDKIHMFDIVLPDGTKYCESDTIKAGTTSVIVDTPLGKTGMAVCYDIRFPHLFHDMAKQGATVFTTPAAYSIPTGEATWAPFVRARAGETGSYVIAAGQCGDYDDGQRHTYGHSMIADPMGNVLAQAEKQEPCVVTAEITPSYALEVRQKIPALQQRRNVKIEECS